MKVGMAPVPTPASRAVREDHGEGWGGPGVGFLGTGEGEGEGEEGSAHTELYLMVGRDPRVISPTLVFKTARARRGEVTESHVDFLHLRKGILVEVFP